MALIYLCLHRSVQGINGHFWQIIKPLDEMTGMLFPLAGAAKPQPRMSTGWAQAEGGEARAAPGQGGLEHGAAFGKRWGQSWEKANPPRCTQERGIWSIFSREQAQPQTLGCLIDFSLLMETTCRTENICKLLRTKKGAAITTGAEGRLSQGSVMLCPFPSISRMFAFPWACCLSFLSFFFNPQARAFPGYLPHMDQSC